MSEYDDRELPEGLSKDAAGAWRQRYRQLEALMRQIDTQLEEARQHLRSVQTQMTAQQKLASLGALAAGIAHEIRNPLNFIVNFAALSAELAQELQTEMANAKAQAGPEIFSGIADIANSIELNMQKITEHSQRAERIVQSMLQHARSEPGMPIPTDLNALLEEYIALAYHSSRAQDSSFNVTITRQLEPSLRRVEVIPQNIARVFLNLLNNAFYAIHSKHRELGDGFTPTLLVRTADHGGHVEIGIRDNGNGIAPEIVDQVFEPFFTTKPASAGTGLGLSISHDIVVQQHRGELRIDTEPGVYTEFIVLLPRHRAQPCPVPGC